MGEVFSDVGCVWNLCHLFGILACGDSSVMQYLVFSSEYQSVEELSVMGMWDSVE